MVDESKVLVIEDDARYRHDLETVLAFLGEDTVPASSSNWTEQVEKNTKASSKIAGQNRFFGLNKAPKSAIRNS